MSNGLINTKATPQTAVEQRAGKLGSAP